MALLLSEQVQAQSFNSISSRIDVDVPQEEPEELASQQPDAGIELFAFDGDPEEEEESAQFSLTLIAQSSIDYDSNISRAGTGKIDAARFRSDFIAVGGAQFKDVSLTTSAILRNDDFSSSDTNDLNFLIFENKLSATGGKVSPYLVYTPILVYSDFLSDRLLTAHELGLGATTSFDIGQSDAGTTKLSVEGNYTHRFATIDSFEEHRPFLKFAVAHPISKRTSLTATSTITPRFFTGGANVDRDDINLISQLSLSQKLGGTVSLQFNVQHEYNDSDQAGSSYSVWDIGPRIVFIQGF